MVSLKVGFIMDLDAVQAHFNGKARQLSEGALDGSPLRLELIDVFNNRLVLDSYSPD